MTALALIVASFTPLPVQVTLAIVAVLVIVYVTVGGLMGDVVTDVIQGTVLIVGLVVLLIAVFARAGGVGEAFALIPEGSLNLIGDGESVIERLDAWAIPILGSLVTVEAVGRFLGARTPKIASWGAFGGAGLYLVLGAIPVLIGLIGGQLGLDIGEGEAFLPDIAKQLLSPVMLVILIGALLSAVLSTVDSNLLGSAGLLTRNILDRFRPRAADQEKLWATRLVTAGCGLFAWAIATRGETIYTLVEWTSALGTSGVLVAFLFGAWSRMGGERAAVAAIVAGLACNAVTMIVIPAITGEEVTGAFLLSILTSLAFYAAATAVLGRGRAGVPTLGG
jgi:Na+/proline symporter